MKFAFDCMLKHMVEVVWSRAIDHKYKLYHTGSHQTGPIYICRFSANVEGVWYQTAEWNPDFFAATNGINAYLHLGVDNALRNVLLPRTYR